MNPSAIDDDYPLSTSTGNAVIALGIRSASSNRVLGVLPLRGWLCFRPKTKTIAWLELVPRRSAV